ncbi:MAG: HEPN domain-containing protein [bacterium]
MKEDSSQLWEEALVRLKVGEEKIKLATMMWKRGEYADATLKIHHAVYHTARAILYAKDIHPDTDSQAIEEFGLNFLQSGIIDKKDVKPYLTFRRVREDDTQSVNVFTTDKEKTLHMLSDAKHFIKDVEKYIQKEIKRRKKVCPS